MGKNNFLLSFELSKNKDELDIHLNEEGLSRLIELLLRFKKHGYQHEHMMTPSWGGNELSEEQQALDSSLLNKVTFHKW